jgi:2-polyprenyl-3-methyl-5-hydroxy-6-metoxy-1,4-benzoquinol methylase
MEPKENAASNTHNVVERLVFDSRTDPRSIVLLDIPCGQGAFAARASQHQATVHAGDIEDLPARAESVRFQKMDMDRRLPFEAEFFTDIVCIDGIEHIERQVDFIRECNRTLRPGGHLVVATPNLSAARSRWRYLWTGHHNKGKTPLDETVLSPLHHRKLLSFPELRYLLHTNGFRIEVVASNRVKTVAWAYVVIWPLCFLATYCAYLREGKNRRRRALNREILRQMLCRDVFFGETLIVQAKKVGRWLTSSKSPPPSDTGAQG